MNEQHKSLAQIRNKNRIYNDYKFKTNDTIEPPPLEYRYLDLRFPSFFSITEKW